MNFQWAWLSHSSTFHLIANFIWLRKPFYELGALISLVKGNTQMSSQYAATTSTSSTAFLIKAFATIVHNLPDAFESLNSPCLSSRPWNDFPFTGFVTMVSTMMIDCSTRPCPSTIVTSVNFSKPLLSDVDLTLDGASVDLLEAVEARLIRSLLVRALSRALSRACTTILAVSHFLQFDVESFTIL
ncbi:hypothetical protein QYF36_001602 [Acer negundo]|nr:hypothetical protein QYF36_001602 [Acer negundo]